MLQAVHVIFRRTVCIAALVLLAGCASVGLPPADHHPGPSSRGPGTDLAFRGDHTASSAPVSDAVLPSKLTRLSEEQVFSFSTAGKQDPASDLTRLASFGEPVKLPEFAPEVESLTPTDLERPDEKTGLEDPVTGDYPIDLPTALALGGASNLQIQIVRERVREAQSDLDKARVLWLPSLQAGLGYNRHDGRLQATEGVVGQHPRNSFFAGGGVALGDSSVAGGSSGPMRLGVDLSLADVWFERLAARQEVCAAIAARDATVNETLLQIATAYFDLVEASGLQANAELGLSAAEKMLELTSKFAQQGQTAQSEVARAETERGLWQQAVEDARREMITRSAELVRLLRLDSEVTLSAVEDRMAPIEIIDGSLPLEVLHFEGLSNRPEIQQYRHLVHAVDERVNQEKWRPWLPHLAVGYAAGSFGGGPSGRFDNQGGRGDFDAVAVWELQHLGLGNAALRGQRISQQRQAYFEYQMVRDKVLAEITTAAADVESYLHQINSLTGSIKAASESYRLNLERIREGEGLPIELLQAIRARADAQDAYTLAVANYNRAQFRLLKTLGRSPGSAGP